MNDDKLEQLQRDAEQFFIRVIMVSGSIAVLCVAGYFIARGS